MASQWGSVFQVQLCGRFIMWPPSSPQRALGPATEVQCVPAAPMWPTMTLHCSLTSQGTLLKPDLSALAMKRYSTQWSRKLREPYKTIVGRSHLPHCSCPCSTPFGSHGCSPAVGRSPFVAVTKKMTLYPMLEEWKGTACYQPPTHYYKRSFQAIVSWLIHSIWDQKWCPPPVFFFSFPLRFQFFLQLVSRKSMKRKWIHTPVNWSGAFDLSCFYVIRSLFKNKGEPRWPSANSSGPVIPGRWLDIIGPVPLFLHGYVTGFCLPALNPDILFL